MPEVADVATQYATALKGELFGAGTALAILIEREGDRDARGRAYVDISQKEFDDLIDGALQLGVKEMNGHDGKFYRFTAIFPRRSRAASESCGWNPEQYIPVVLGGRYDTNRTYSSREGATTVLLEIWV